MIRRAAHVLAVLALASSSCKSPDPSVKGDPAAKEEHAKKKSKPEPAPIEKGLRVLLDPPMLRLDGAELTLGMKTDALKKAMGKPTKSTDYGPGEGAMTNTTYLSYADQGMSIRTKKGKVEGFYVYFKEHELDGVSFAAAKPKLPGDLPLDASLDDVVAALGEPTKRTPLAAMNWMDLEYVRGDARFKFHFDTDVFRSVSLELDDLKLKEDEN